MNATIYFQAEHFNYVAGCTIPAGYKATISGQKLAPYECPIPDQFYGNTRDEAECNVRKAFPGIKRVSHI